MSYLTQAHISSNTNMMARVAQAAASEGISNPDYWCQVNARQWAAAPGWDEAWEYALNTHTDDPDYDPGEDEAVVTDGMILSQVQLMNPPPEEA